jgi:hypothetical protein
MAKESYKDGFWRWPLSHLDEGLRYPVSSLGVNVKEKNAARRLLLGGRAESVWGFRSQYGSVQMLFVLVLGSDGRALSSTTSLDDTDAREKRAEGRWEVQVSPGNEDAVPSVITITWTVIGAEWRAQCRVPTVSMVRTHHRLCIEPSSGVSSMAYLVQDSDHHLPSLMLLDYSLVSTGSFTKAVTR